MTGEANPVGGEKAWEMLVGEGEAGRWARPIVQNWGYFFLGFVLLVAWLPSRGTVKGSAVLRWIATYVVYLFCLEILSRRARELYETKVFQGFRIHFNLLMTTLLAFVVPPSASDYLWFFFSMPLLATLGYFSHRWPLVIVYLEVFAAMLVLTVAQGWPNLQALVRIVAQTSILGLLTAVFYFFLHLFPRRREESTLLKAATTLMQGLDRGELTQLLADAAKSGIPASDGAVVHLLAGEQNRTLVPMGSSHLDLTALGRSPMKIGVGIAGHAIQSRETIHVPDVSKDARYHRLPSSFLPFSSLLVAPMYVGDKNVGSISVHSTKKGTFDARDQRFLIALSAQGAMAIANAELYDTRTRRRRQVSDILAASMAFGLGQPLDALLEVIASEVCRCSGYRMAVVNLFDKASNELVVRAIAGVPPSGVSMLKGLRIPFDIVKPLLQEEFRLSRSYFVRHDRCPQIPGLDQYSFTPDLGKRRLGEWHQEDMLIVPIWTQEERLLGYISVDDPLDRQLPTLDTVQALEILANVAATAIQSAHLYDQAQREIAERRRVEDSLAREQHLLQTFMDNVPDNIYFKDRESRFIRINRSLTDWFGLSDPAQAKGKTDFDFFSDEHAQQAYTDEQKVMRTGESLSLEEKETWPDGRETWVATTKMPLRDESGDIIGTFGISKDITQRKQAAMALWQRNRELALLNRAGQAVTSTLDLDQVLVNVLEEVRRLLDVTGATVWLIESQTQELVCQQAVGPRREDVLGWRLAPGEGIAGWVAQHGECLVVPDTRNDKRHYKRLDQLLAQESRSILCVPLIVKRRVIGVLQMVDTDVDRFETTDLSLVESLAATATIAIENARLYQETDRLRAFNENIVQSMEEGILIQDADGYITFVNRRTAELLGYAPAEMVGRHWTTLGVSGSEAEIEEGAAKRPQGIPGRYETALLTNEGQRVPVLVSVTPLFEQGSFTGVLAVYTDITARKQQEARLREYLSTVTNSLAQHTSLEGLYQFIVEAGSKLLSARDCALFLTRDKNGEALELAAATKSPFCENHSLVRSDPTGNDAVCQLVAHVAATGKPIRLLGEEVAQYPAWQGKPCPGFGPDSGSGANSSVLAAPMCLPDGHLVGVLVARDAVSARGFSEFEEVLIQTLGSNAAADIERVKSMEKARAEAVRDERKRLETDLHDAMNVLATGVRWEAEILEDELAHDNLPAARIALRRLLAALLSAYEDLRHLLEDLRDPTLESKGLLIALRKRAELVGRGRILVYGDSWERLPPKTEAALYRVGQEAISNAVKHSGFVQNPDVKIEVWLERDDEQVKLFVRDNGTGFDVESAVALSTKWGLRRMRDALHDIGGELDIDSVPGKGTTVCANADLTWEE